MSSSNSNFPAFPQFVTNSSPTSRFAQLALIATNDPSTRLYLACLPLKFCDECFSDLPIAPKSLEPASFISVRFKLPASYRHHRIPHLFLSLSPSSPLPPPRYLPATHRDPFWILYKFLEETGLQQSAEWIIVGRRTVDSKA